jgi:hypothetical protein
MQKDGKSLEQLIAVIEKVLGKEETVKVDVRAKLPDRITGQPREHDVLLTVKSGHHTVLIAIECRDRSRPVIVNDVESFQKKCEDTGVNQGVIVSTSGFANTARTKADHVGIRCLDLEEAESFNWLMAPGFHVIERRLEKQHWDFFPEKDGVVAKENMELIDAKGDPIGMNVLTANAQRVLNESVPEASEPAAGREFVVRVSGAGLTLRNTQTKETVPVMSAVARLTYSVTHHMAPFRLVQYRDKAEDKPITDAALAEFKFGERVMQVMIVYKEGQGGQVLLVPKKAK